MSGNPTILVVDDDQTIRRLVRSVLKRWGNEVCLADSGEAALETFKLYRPAVRAVLTDIIMGGMSGIELAERLHEISPALPVIFMSGQVESRQLRGCTVLRKPFRLDELKQAITAALHGGEGEGETQ